ncbi:MAG: serine protease [Eubacterium sp.]|nr:serine protease [Eubacterium sp.]
MADNFQFIKETRKEKPMNRKKIIHRALEAIILAVIFGAVSCLTFVLLQPRLEQYFSPEEPPQLTFTEPELPEEPEKPVEEESEEAASEETDEKKETETLIIEKTTPMTLKQYQTLQNKLYAIGKEADKFVVSVTNVKSDTDIFHTTYESKGVGSGVIIADTGEHLLILTEKKTIQGAASLRVTFVDGATVKAELQQYDGNTGIAVVRVDIRDISEETMDHIAVATLGSSIGVTQGQVVLAIGSPTGTIHSILSGNITSNRNSITTMDCNYTVFSTDIIGSANASGVLINTDGEVIGFVLQDYNLQEEQTTLAAVSISELKSVIELLSNDKSVPYLGLRVSTVTEQISEDYQMPKGVYVREVALDSPAMQAGFQSGDVITEINGEPVLTVENYGKLIRKFAVDDIITIKYERQGADSYIQLEIEAKIGVLE